MAQNNEMDNHIMTIDQLRFFIAVAQNKSFSNAADRLHISQSSVSKSIIALESELGFPLFERKKKGIELTEAAEILLEDALELEGGYFTFMRRAQQLTEKYRSSIHIIAYPLLTQYGIFEKLAPFREQHPEVRLVIEEPDDYDLLTMLQKGLCDFAVVRDTGIFAPEYDGIMLAEDHISLFASEQSPLAGMDRVNLLELRDEGLLFMRDGLPIHQICLRACMRAGFEPNIVGTARIETLLGHVRSAGTPALLAHSITTIFQMRGIRAIPVEPAVSCNVVLTWKKNMVLDAPKQKFLQYLHTMQGG